MKLRSRVAAAFGLVVLVTVALLASGWRSAAASSQGKCDFGPCRGLLRAGTYSSREFFPTLTYTVPAGGWANYTDWAGNFSLAPPGVSRAKERNGVDAIEVIAVVQAPEANCSGNADLKVPQTVNGIVHWLVRQGGLVASVPRRVAIGGLKGYSLTLRLARRGGIHCGGGSRSFPVIVGGSGSSSASFIGVAGLSDRVKIYLLTVKGLPLAIVADSVGRHGPSLAADIKIISHFHFAKF